MRCLSLVMLLVTACASPKEQAFKPETLAPASAFTQQQSYLIAADGAPLPLYQWLPESKPKAIILALHGFNDYGHAFTLPAEALAAKQIGVIAYDQRGFGKTAQRGIWAGQKNLVRDLRHAITAIHQRYPDVPLFVLGESMGGAVAIVACANDGCPKVKGVILSAPAVWGENTFSLFFRVPLWVMAHSFPSSQFTGEDVKIQASDNIPMLIAMGKDPLIIKKTRVDAIYGLVGLMDEAYAQAPELTLPALVLYGAKDEVIPAAPVRCMVETMKPMPDFKLYPQGYHMLLRDLGRKAVADDVADWILDHR